ncbi:MAG: hypothetical protein ACYTF8_08580 [Planctomycetota bacterium]|jgi:hypothetical protein
MLGTPLLALSTLCADADRPLDRVVASFRDLGVRAVALHRPAQKAEARGLAAIAKMARVVAVFGGEPGADVGTKLLVVEGGPAADDREASLESLCRRLHALRDWTVALRTPSVPDHHPAPGEIALVREALGNVGYWHDAARGGEAYLEVAGRYLLGASFDPLAEVDLAGLRGALPAAAPAVVTRAPGTARDEVVEALRCARGIFGN